ncbi:MAG: ribosome assembly RNA-binding protein YhbY [Firmicutes bacterium]|nr:ribosome assembly RNA-binding protein YhbY [Bacillota bacterium]
MITSKQRSYLKSLAHNLDPIVHIGKDGLTENVIKEMNICLENRELIKVKLQEGAILGPKETANEAAQILGAEFVQAIGRKFVLYRFSKERAKEGKQIVLPR